MNRLSTKVVIKTDRRFSDPTDFSDPKDFPDLSSLGALQTVGAYSFLLSSIHFGIEIRLSRKKTCITRAPSFATKSIMQVGGSRMLNLRALTFGISQSPKSVLIKKHGE